MRGPAVCVMSYRLGTVPDGEINCLQLQIKQGMKIELVAMNAFKERESQPRLGF